MAERPDAMVNAIMDAIVYQIRTHAETNPHLWSRLPVSVKRYQGPSDLRGTFPLIVVGAEGPFDDLFSGTLNVHRAECGFRIGLYDEDTQDPEARAHDAAADIRRALAADEQLNEVLNSGSLDPRGYDWGIGTGETGAGAIEVILRYRANFEWTHDVT